MIGLALHSKPCLIRSKPVGIDRTVLIVTCTGCDAEVALENMSAAEYDRAGDATADSPWFCDYCHDAEQEALFADKFGRYLP